MKKLLLFAFAACALAACSDDDGDSRVPATAVVLDCTEKELAVGETLQLTATPAPANTTDDVVWSSDAEEFATVSESGLVTAVVAGTAKISATYGSVSATCTVHVSEPDPDPNPDPEPEPSNLISFETSEGMLAIDGKAVQLGDITVSGGSAAGNHHNVFWAKGGSYDDLAVGGFTTGIFVRPRMRRFGSEPIFQPTSATETIGAVSSCLPITGERLRASIMRTSLWYGPIREQTVRRTA